MLPIVYEDRALIVIDKPAFLPTSGRTLDDPECAQHRLARQLGEHVWAVHQIDATTTGLNLFVRRKSAVAVFVHKLKQGIKQYIALVDGRPEWSALRIDAPIGWDEASRAWAVTPEGRTAVSDAERVAVGPHAAAVAVRIATGRTHQVRIHMASVGHPLLGDHRYGGRTDPARTAAGLERPMLHAYRLRIDGVPELVAPLAADFVAAAGAEGLSLSGWAGA